MNQMKHVSMALKKRQDHPATGAGIAHKPEEYPQTAGVLFLGRR
jgi:hypothetical protein